MLRGGVVATLRAGNKASGVELEGGALCLQREARPNVYHCERHQCPTA